MQTDPVIEFRDDRQVIPGTNVPATLDGAHEPNREVDGRFADSIALQGAIREIVLDRAVQQFDKRRQIRDLAREHLLTRGFFCQTADGRGFYFDKSVRRLYDLEQRAFQHLLSAASGLGAMESYFKFVLDFLQTEAALKAPVQVHTESYYDQQSGRVVVSDGAGGTWHRERGGEWQPGFNGDDKVFFLTDPDAEPWMRETSTSSGLAWFLAQLCLDRHAPLEIEEQKTLFTVFVLQTFFPALRRTRIIPALLGPQGSGKTSAMRLYGTLLCGPEFDVTMLNANREDAFVAAVCNRVLVALDNADTRVRWLEDSLATYATGHRYRLRRLYTTNEEVSYSPRAILLLSSRDPHFRRPDVAERLLPLNFERPERYQPESVLFGELLKRRGAIMSELLDHVARIADSLAGRTLPALPFRMADFASFGWAVAQSARREDEWENLLRKLDTTQMQFAGDGDSVVIVLRKILESDGTIGPLDSGDLYQQCSRLAGEQSLPFPRSPQGFGKRLTNMRRVIEVELGADFCEERLGWKRLITIKKRGA